LEVAADVREALARLGHRLAVVTTGAAADLAQARYLGAAILNGVHDDLAALAELDRSRGAAPPPGMPIGASSGEDGWFSESLTIGN
jgi:hypothetical protein